MMIGELSPCHYVTHAIVTVMMMLMLYTSDTSAGDAADVQRC